MEDTALWNAAARGDACARDALLRAHLTLVHHVVRQVGARLTPRREMDDLVSAGTLGLITAVDNFDVTRGLAFSTYAIPCIRGAILDEMRRQDHAPRSVRRKQRLIAEARAALGARMAGEPSERDLAEHLGLDATTMRHWSAAVAGAAPVSIEGSLTREDGEMIGELAEPAAAAGPDLDEAITREQEMQFLARSLDALTAQERQVLVLYYHEELKMHEIAAILGVTESRISQVRTRALARLRVRMAPLRAPVSVELAG
ncbi:MAG: FliA/WhiG family RNA polymerase sigma factor [Gemmatimonadota bacterium]|nr:FliA/WhiG family RNA polymerase sigma factor [Gemmatimonadota bacterium]